MTISRIKTHHKIYLNPGLFMQKPLSANVIIGGMFGLQATSDSDACFPPFIQPHSLYLVNARSGIRFLADRLAPRQVWCPSYLCHTILEAVKGSLASVRFYEVNYLANSAISTSVGCVILNNPSL